MADARTGGPNALETRSDGATFVENFLKGERALLARVKELTDERRRRGRSGRSPHEREPGARR